LTPEDRGRGDIRIDVYLFVISNEYENRPQIEEYASLPTHPANVRYQERFLRAYKEARENRRGFWR
jgi:hypothetical protein